MNWEPEPEDLFVQHVPGCTPCLHSASVASACAIVGAAVGSASTWVYLRAYASHQERVLAVSRAECASEAGAREPGGLSCSPCRDDYTPPDSLEQDKTSPSDEEGEMESSSTVGCLPLGPSSPTLARDADTTSVAGSPVDSIDTSPGWDVGPVIWRGALTEVLQKAEYSGARDSPTPEDLLLEIAQDAPQRWNMADFHFVTHCNSLMHILEAHGDRRAQAGRIFISRVKQQMAEHMHILNQSTQLAYHAREDKRKSYDHRNQQRQVRHPRDSEVHIEIKRSAVVLCTSLCLTTTMPADPSRKRIPSSNAIFRHLLHMVLQSIPAESVVSSQACSAFAATSLPKLAHGVTLRPTNRKDCF